MLNLLISFFKITLSSFGGGAVITALMQKEFVNTGIITPSDFIYAVGLTQITPGPMAPATAAYVGYRLFGITGVLITSLGLFLPSLIIAIIISKVFARLKDNKIIENVFMFLKSITVALVVSVFIFFLKISVFDNHTFISLNDFISYFNIKAAFIFVVSLLFMQKFKNQLIYIIIVSGLLGAAIL